MPIRVKCEQCKKTLGVKDALAGKRIKCPVCQTAILVPEAATAGGAAESSSSDPAAPATGAPAAGKKPAVMGKPVAKPAADRAKTNGTSDPAKNGTPTPPPTPEIVDRPHEHAEAEALAAFQEELKPKEEEGPPKTIDFTCEHCDHELHVALEEGGKRMQCPECRQLIKVPMPKIEAKKDWRKMDRVGPAAALINQPEQLEDAWGSQNATKARQDSLAKAGALQLPPKPKRDAAGWIYLIFYTALGVAAVGLLGNFAWVKLGSAKQHRDIDELKELAGSNGPNKIANDLLRAEAKRVLALLYLKEPKGEYKSKESIDGAEVVIDDDENVPAVNQQLFLIDKAFALIEQGGEGEEQDFLHIRREWSKVYDDLAKALGKIRDPELQAIAVREVTNRLIQKKKIDLASQLAAQIAAAAKDEMAPVLGQKIAFSVLINEADAIEEFAPDPAKPPLEMQRIDDANVRSGFAEGYARKGEFDKAAKIALADGEAKDRVEACLGVASIAMAAKKPDEASKCVKEVLKIAEGADKLTDWNLLELIRLTARTEGADTAKDLIDKLTKAEFKSRAHLEIILAKCEKATGSLNASELAGLEGVTTDKDFVPLALAWEALARNNTKAGASRGDNRKMFEAHIKGANVPPEVWDHLRQMVDVGSFLGSFK